MPNVKVKERDRAKTRAISLSDNEVKYILEVGEEKSLTRAIRNIIEMIKEGDE